MMGAEGSLAEGQGVFEIADDHRGDTYRAVYVVRFADVVYTLHAFQKTSTQASRPRWAGVRLISRRLKRAQSRETGFRVIRAPGRSLPSNLDQNSGLRTRGDFVTNPSDSQRCSAFYR
jgi:hypothetical protein